MELQAFYEDASQYPLDITEFQEGFVKGKVVVPEGKSILFTSIPYDKGWKLTSPQGEVEKIALLDGAFLGVSFPAGGEYELQFTYEAPGRKIGVGISVVSFLIFCGLLFLDKKSIKNY